MTASADSAIEAAIRQVVEGDTEAFAAVVDAHGPLLQAWAAARCGSALDPDEVAHRTFIKAFQLLAQYRPGSDFRAWLLAIARNVLRAEATQAQRRLGRQQPVADLAAVDDPGTSESEQDARRLAALRACLEQLPGHLRGMLDQHYRDGRPLAEIAAGLGRSLMAVKKALFKTRRRLHDCIGAEPAHG